MTSLLHFNQYDIKNIITDINPNTQMKFYNDIIAMTGITKDGFVDRTGTIDSPMRIKVLNSEQLLPGFYDRNPSLEACYADSVKRLVSLQDRLDRPLMVTYSGGVDSHSIMCALIRELGINQCRERVTVMLDSHSIYENPSFYLQWIEPHFRVVSSASWADYLPPSCILINGEPAGFVAQTRYVEKIYKEMTVTMLEKSLDLHSLNQVFLGLGSRYHTQQHLEVFHDMIQTSASQVGIKLNNILDMAWWLSFNFRWNNVIFVLVRMFRSYQPLVDVDETFFQNYFVPFYHTNNWQAWSYHHRQDQIENLVTGDYKSPMKKYIFELTGDLAYRNLKGKVGSLIKPNYLEVRTTCNAINDQFRRVLPDQFPEYIQTSQFLEARGILPN